MVRSIRDRVFPGEDPEPGAWALALDRARIPHRYRRATLEAIRDPELVTWARSLLDAPGRWLGQGFGLMFVGPYRSGKSSLGALFAMDAIQRCERVLWTAAREIPGIMFREDAAGFDALKRADLLVIDDLGAEKYRLDGGGGAALEGAVRSIYDRERSVLVTSNLSPARIKDVYPDGLVSVLERMTACKVVENDQWPRGPEGLV